MKRLLNLLGYLVSDLTQNELAARGVLGKKATEVAVLPVRDDEVAYTTGARVNGAVQGALDRVGLGSFWVR